jgi:hypothetical protein
MVYSVPAVILNAVPVLKPPAPPPPDAPPPPPATTRYSTSVTPVGATHEPEVVKVLTSTYLVPTTRASKSIMMPDIR